MKLTLRDLEMEIEDAFMESGLTMRELSRISDVPYSTLWNLWNTRFSPTLSTAIRLAEALGIRLEIK